MRMVFAATASVLVLAGAAAVATVPARAAGAGCAVTYTVGSQWQGGFSANVSVTNLGDPVTGWTLTWSFGAGQQVTQAWNAVVSQSAAAVTARNASWNGALATGGSAGFGFNGAWNGSANPVPASFALNGTTCTGAVTASPSPSSSPSAGGGGSLPSSFRWSDQGIVLSPKTAAGHPIVSVKDPTIVWYNNQYLVYATTADTSGNWSLEYTHFTDFSQAASAPQYYLSDNPNIGGGYRAAPQLFYFAPKNKWFLVYQQGPPAYSTADDPTQPQTWSAPTNFISSEPAVVTQNKGGGGWLDFWVICDPANCYLFFSDDNGTLYRAQTTVANFPGGFGNTVVVMKQALGDLFEASNVYKVKGSNTYLLTVEAFDTQGRRYFRSWTSTDLAGSWTPLANTPANPFAGLGNVTFTNGQWTNDVSHGEMIRDGYDQTLEISPCHLRYLYQGRDPNSSGAYPLLPWRLGLLTQANSTC
jgi:endo-1,4-beta-xylanase